MIIPKTPLLTVKDYKEWFAHQEETSLVGIALTNGGVPTIAVLTEEELAKINLNIVHDGRQKKEKDLAICKRSN